MKIQIVKKASPRPAAGAVCPYFIEDIPPANQKRS